MTHILAKIRGAQLSEVEKLLKKSFMEHAAEGMFLEHLWQNRERSDEVLFLLRTMNPEKAKEFMDTKHKSLRDSEGLPFPEMIFLEGK